MIIPFKNKSSYKKSFSLFQVPKTLFPAYLILIVSVLLFVDKPLSLFFYSVSGEIKEPFLLLNKLFSPFFSILLFPTLFFLVRFVLKNERKSRVFWLLSIACPVAVFSSEIICVILGRSTPSWFFDHRETVFRFFQWNPSFQSFPSAISCNIGAIIGSLSCLYPKFTIKLIIGGFILSLIPAFLTFNFLSDSLAGVGVGVILSCLVFKCMKKEVLV